MLLHQSKALLASLSIALLTLVLVLGTHQILNPVNVRAELPNKVAIVHRYESPKMDAVNLYWLETSEGIILIDTGRFLSQARYALEEIRAVTDKPIIGIFITHPHTDHYGGLPIFTKAAIAKVPIYASQIVYEDIKNDGQGFIRVRKELHGNDFPDPNEIPLPNRIVKDGELIQLGGLTLEAIELLKNESLVTTLYYLPEQQAMFVGDLATQSVPFLNDGYSGNWIAQLKMILDRYPNLKTIYPGHGKPGAAKKLIQAQIEYLEIFRNLVANAIASDGEITIQEKANIVARMQQRYPNYSTSLLVPNLIERGIDGIIKELKG